MSGQTPRHLKQRFPEERRKKYEDLFNNSTSVEGVPPDERAHIERVGSLHGEVIGNLNKDYLGADVVEYAPYLDPSNADGFLLEVGLDPHPRDRWVGTPLHDAQLAGHSDVAELLDARGANPGDPQHPAGESKATEEAAHYGDTDGVVELLWAASEGDIEGLRRCLACGMPVSAADYDGRTALHLAASTGQADAVAYLLAHDHLIHVRDRWAATPLDDARREHRNDVVDLDLELSGMGSKLIRKLTNNANYRRDGDANILSLTFELSGSIAADA